MLDIKNQENFATQCPDIFTPEAIAFIAKISDAFSARGEAILESRREAQQCFDDGDLPGFLPDTRDLRADEWRVAAPPANLQDRRVEITAPAERQKVIQALNSAAKVYMADFEDSMSPTWQNIISGQQALYDAVRGACETTNPQTGKHYTLNPSHTCELIVRPRGWHLAEKHVLWKGRPIIAAFVDFGLFFFHNAKILAERNRGPYFYLPKTEHWREAALWHDIMSFAEKELQLPPNCCRATLLIETLPAVFQMHEILHAMRERLVGLNCGRWDYIFSYIKTLANHPGCVLPARAQVSMACPFLRAYSLELIDTCHRRGAHAMGGMSAFIPIRDDEQANAAALKKVREDKIREAESGHDGTWVAHPGLIETAAEIFNARMPQPNQTDKILGKKHTAAELLAVPTGDISLADFDNNIQVALRYITAWLNGNGAVPIFNMMEDAATAEISRAQLWQWLRYPTKLSDGADISTALFANRLQAAVNNIKSENGNGHLHESSDMLESLVCAPQMTDFLTLGAYDLLA